MEAEAAGTAEAPQAAIKRGKVPIVIALAMLNMNLARLLDRVKVGSLMFCLFLCFQDTCRLITIFDKGQCHNEIGVAKRKTCGDDATGMRKMEGRCFTVE